MQVRCALACKFFPALRHINRVLLFARAEFLVCRFTAALRVFGILLQQLHCRSSSTADSSSVRQRCVGTLAPLTHDTIAGTATKPPRLLEVAWPLSVALGSDRRDA